MLAVVHCRFTQKGFYLEVSALVKEYEQYDEQFEEHDLKLYPSAIQGFFTGFLSSGKRLNKAQIQEFIQQYLELEDALEESVNAIFYRMYQQTLADLSSVDMEFDLLIADESQADVDEQTEQLAAWCKGFLDGLGVSGIQNSQIDEDAKEILADFDVITQAEVDDPQNPENVAFFEQLKEHCRISALSIFYQFNRQTPTASEQVH